MILSPVAAIADMVTPVVLITLATIFGNGLMSASLNLADNVHALDRERLAILRGPGGEMLDEGSVPPVDRVRLTLIEDEQPRMIRRIGYARRAIAIIWIGIGLLVLSVAAIAVAVTARSEAFAFTALALVLAGVTAFFAALASMIVPIARPTEAVIEEDRHRRILP